MLDRHRTPVTLAILGLCVALVAACGELPPPTPTAMPSSAPAAAAPTNTLPLPTNTLPAPTNTIPVATATAKSAPPSAAPVVPVGELAAQLAALLKPALPTPGATPGAGTNLSINAIPLQSSLGNLWLAHSVGLSYVPQFKHFVAVYSNNGGAWQQLAKTDLQCANYLDQKGVKQVQIEPSRVWIEVDGGTGAHGGCFDMYSFDGKALTNQVSRQTPSPGMGSVQDLLGDGTNVVVLDESDPYVFCYACGVRFSKFSVLRWNGSALAEVKPADLPASAPAELRTLNNQAVTWAQARLWKDALQSIDKAVALKSQDRTVAWNAALIHLTGDAQAKGAEGYPLLDAVFLGDYDTALNMLRQYPPTDLFGKAPSVVTGPAKGWEKSITQWITQTASLQLAARPDLAGAYFMLSWGINLTNPSSPDVLAHMQKAAQLAPNDALIAQSLAHLKTR